MRVLIIEDEHLSAKRLRKMILQKLPEASFLDDIESVREGEALFSGQAKVDLIFSDIQLADGLSFEIFRKHKIKAPIIFTTAYDQYALEAFRSNGLDYLVKPIDSNELFASIDKYEQLFRPTDNSLMLELSQMLSSKNKNYRERFMVKAGEHIRSISSAEIMAFYSAEKANFLLNSEGRNYGIESSMERIEEELDPSRFFRINRGYILAYDYIDEVVAWSNSRLRVIIKGMEKHELIVARDRTSKFKIWLGQ